MFLNFLKTAFRSLFRQRRHAILNISGLAVALAACIVIFLVIQYEYSYDRHLEGYKSIYHIVGTDKDAEGEHYTTGISFPAVKMMRKDYPQYQFAELMQNSGVQITAKNLDGSMNGKKFIEPAGVFYADPEIMKMFEVKFLAGSAESLKDLNSVVLSRTMASKYFGDWKEAMGRRINMDNLSSDFQIAGVFEDLPTNTDFPFTLVISYEGFVKYNPSGWPLDSWGATSSSHQLYVKLPDEGSIASINSYLAGFEKKYNTENKDSKRSHFLNPLSAVHFDERFGTNGDHVSSKRSLLTLGFIGLLIILMACINFVNLSTALAVKRSKEVGIRKVMGGNTRQLQLQVFAETFIVVSIATVLALFLAWLSLPYIKSIMVVQDKLSLLSSGMVLFVLGITLITAFLSGLYPAIVMGRFQPVEAIKNKINTAKVGSVSLRRVLVVLQFSFSQILVIATIIAISQMSFIRNVDLGFNKEAVLMISGNSDSVSHSRMMAFRDALQSRSDVKSVSFSFDAPSSDNSWQSNFAFDIMEDKDFPVALKMGDENYLKTYDIKLLAGRNYRRSDTATEYIINETMLKKVGLKTPQEAIGKMLRLGGSEPKPVIGVVKDFKLQSLKEAISPIVLMPRTRFYSSTGIKLDSKNLAASKAAIEGIWNKFYPEYVFNAKFLDDNIQEFYIQEERLSTMYKVCALLALFISCLGLYGLISFMVVQKTREVGIRKVLGAGVNSILYLFSKEFTILIIISFVLAVPAAWYLMHTWLQDFVYRVDMGPLVFIGALLLTLVIAWITVGYKALKAALANPVKSLRTE